MAIIRLSSESGFPAVGEADAEGLLALGGDLGVERLLLAYRSGIFPWYGEGLPVLWWSPDPRHVLFPDRLKVSASMSRIMRSGRFRITCNRDFRAVIEACRTVPRPGQAGTWITDDMIAAYVRLHEEGHAHSVEAWREDRLVGGLYGVSIGRAFFGESMFATESNASKAAFITLVERLRSFEFEVIDCQVYTPHLERLGAEPMPRAEFIELLEHATAKEIPVACWDAGAWEE